jgi:hypothetical protein
MRNFLADLRFGLRGLRKTRDELEAPANLGVTRENGSQNIDP